VQHDQFIENDVVCLLLLLLLHGVAVCPAAMFVWFIALAIPFFGVVNDLMGAFCVTFET
jgi:hypothetical protein